MTAISKIDIEATAAPDVTVDAEVIAEDVVAIHGDEGFRPQQGHLDTDSPFFAALSQWFGQVVASAMSVNEVETLKRMITRLPDPVPQTSFAWDVVKKPNDIRHLAEAIDLYRRFNQVAVQLSDAMGANTEIRNVIRAEKHDIGRTFASYIAEKRENMSKVEALSKVALDLTSHFQEIFAKKELSISAAIVAVVGLQSAEESREYLASGFNIPREMPDTALAEIDRLRKHIVSSAEKIRRITGVNPMSYSMTALSGVSRSLGEDASGDFRFAVEGLGGSVNADDDLLAASQAFKAFFEQNREFDCLLQEHGLDQVDVPALLSHVLMRRHFMTAAREANIQWSEIQDELVISNETDFQRIAEFLKAGSRSGITGQLLAVAAGKLDRPLADVVKAARKHIVTQEYWLVAGELLTAIDDGIRFVDLQEVLRMEPEIDQARQALLAVGAKTRDDVDVLERHVDWMTRAYALPISDEAVNSIIETKSGIIPLTICGRAGSWSD